MILPKTIRYNGWPADGFRLLNSEIGNDLKVALVITGNYSQRFRLLNSEIGNDRNKNVKINKKRCRFSSP